MAYNVWPPYVCGMLVGGLQLPLVLLMDKTLGGSSSVSFMVAQLFVGPLEKVSPYVTKFRRWSMETYWQVSDAFKCCSIVTAVLTGLAYNLILSIGLSLGLHFCSFRRRAIEILLSHCMSFSTLCPKKI